MTENSGAQATLGPLLESARTNVLRISAREAARRAGVSESRWRQVVRGHRASDRVIVAMALAVEIDPGEALTAAGLPVRPEHLDALIQDVRRGLRTREPEGGDRMAAEIERIQGLPLSASDRLRMIRALVKLYEEQAAQTRNTA